MTTTFSIFVLLVICIVSTISVLRIIDTQIKTGQLKTCFKLVLICILICLTGLILQCLLGYKLSLPLIYYDYFVYIGTCFLPVTMFFTSLVFANTKAKLKKVYLLLIIPIISLIVLWTNDYHHLFYKVYSINLNETISGSYMTVHLIYTYGLFIISITNLLKYTIKNAGFFSKQSIFIIIGTLIPILVNILGTFNILPMTIYITPISFAFTILCFSIAIFRFKFLSITPIAMQKIVDRISDAFIVLNENYIITDFNETFLHIFSCNPNDVRQKNIFKLSSKDKHFKINNALFQENFEKIKHSNKTIEFEQTIDTIAKTFSIEISNIFSKNELIGTLILFKDITQHKNDILTIQNNQDMLIEQERLASLGQMIGGIAHNLKTPIFSVAGGLEGLSDLINEYDASIENPSVTDADMHDIAKDMREWIDKLKGHISYMSDVITTVKGQTTTLADNATIDFSITELFKRVDILMKHEIKNALATLEIQNNIGDAELLNGNINSLVQIINNIISNSIEAYGNNYTNKIIELAANQENNNLIISVKDYGPGIPPTAQEKLFKEMITTKGKNGTGLGMFMSYSNIKAHFSGDMTYETELGKGTTFYIILPIKH